MHCFERAGLDREAAVSHAYFLREQARTTIPTTSKQSVRQYQQAFCNAAEAFLQCSESAINPKEKNTYLRNAGDCYEKAEENFKAAEAYNHAQEFTKAAKLYRKTAKFDDAVAVVTAHREKIDDEVAENIIDVAKLFYFKNGDLEYVMNFSVHIYCALVPSLHTSKASKLFDSVDEQFEYLEDFDLDVSRAALFESLGKFHDAAKIHLYEGRTSNAIQLFLKDDTNVASLHCARDCILRGLWENVSFGMKISESLTEVVGKHLNYASSLKDVGIATEEVGNRVWKNYTIPSLIMTSLEVIDIPKPEIARSPYFACLGIKICVSGKFHIGCFLFRPCFQLYTEHVRNDFTGCLQFPQRFFAFLSYVVPHSHNPQPLSR